MSRLVTAAPCSSNVRVCQTSRWLPCRWKLHKLAGPDFDLIGFNLALMSTMVFPSAGWDAMGAVNTCQHNPKGSNRASPIREHIELPTRNPTLEGEWTRYGCMILKLDGVWIIQFISWLFKRSTGSGMNINLWASTCMNYLNISELWIITGSKCLSPQCNAHFVQVAAAGTSLNGRLLSVGPFRGALGSSWVIPSRCFPSQHSIAKSQVVFFHVFSSSFSAQTKFWTQRHWIIINWFNWFQGSTVPGLRSRKSHCARNRLCFSVAGLPAN